MSRRVQSDKKKQQKPNESWRSPTEEERAEFRKLMNEGISARLDMFAANAPTYANP